MVTPLAASSIVYSTNIYTDWLVCCVMTFQKRTGNKTGLDHNTSIDIDMLRQDIYTADEQGLVVPACSAYLYFMAGIIN